MVVGVFGECSRVVEIPSFGSRVVKHRVSGIAVAALLSSVSGEALAQACTDTIPGADGIVTCTIVTTDTHVEFDAGVTINIEDTASLNGAVAFSIFNTDSTINNDGTINGSTTFLIGVSDDVFVNTGVVTGTVAMVQGNDQFTNADGGVVNGIVDMGSFGGAGDNTITLQSGSTVTSLGSLFMSPAGMDVLNIEEGAVFLGTANALSNVNSVANISADGIELSSLIDFAQVNINTSGTTTLNVASTYNSNIDLNSGVLSVNSASLLNGLVEVNGGTLDANTASTYAGGVTLNSGFVSVDSASLFSGLVTVAGGSFDVNTGSTLSGGAVVTGGALNINQASTIIGALNATDGVVSLGTESADANLAAGSVSIGANARLEGRGDFGDFVSFVAPIQIDGEIAPDLVPADVTLIGNGNVVLSSSSVLDLTVGFGQDIGAAAGSEQELFASTLGSNNTSTLSGGTLRINSTPVSEFVFGEFTVDAVSSFVSTTGDFGTIDTGDDFVLIGTSNSGFASSVTLQSVFAGGPCAMTTPGDGGVIDCSSSTNNDISILNENVNLNIAENAVLGGTTLFSLVGPSDDSVVNAGTIDGVVGMVQGNDQFTNADGGVVNGIVDLGSFGGLGDNTITLQTGSTVSETGQLFLSQVGNDVLNIEEGATFLGTATAAAGNAAGNPAAIVNIGADGVELTDLIGFGVVNIASTGTVTVSETSTQLGSINLQSGLLDVSAATTFSQAVDVSGGTLALNAPTTFDDGLVLGAGSRFDQNAGATVNGAGVMVGAGGTIELGASDLGANLETQNLMVASGGFFGGSGAFGSFTPNVLADIVLGGVVAPDARSDATLLATTFTGLGNVTLADTSELVASFGAGLPGGGDQTEVFSSILGVTGTTTLEGGALTLRPVEGSQALVGVFNLPVVSSAGVISGEFGDVTVEGNFIISDIDYFANSIFVTVQTFFGAGQDYRDDADALVDYLNSVVNSSVSSTQNALETLVVLDPTNGDLETALQEVAPQSYASASGISRGLGFGIIEAVSGGNQYRQVTEGAKTMWVSGVYADSSQSSDTPGISGFDSQSAGVLFGFDYALNNAATIGGFSGYVDFDQRFDDLAAQTDGDGFAVGAKGEINYSDLQIQVIVGKVFGEAETNRSFGALASGASDNFDLDTAFARASFAYALDVSDRVAVTPHARLTLLRSTVGDFQETSDIDLAFAADSQTTDFTYGDLGLTIAAPDGVFGGQLRSYLEGGARYELLGNEAVSEAGFVGESTRYIVQGLETDRTAGYLRAGATWSLTDSLSISLDGQNVFGGDFNRYNVLLRLSGQF